MADSRISVSTENKRGQPFEVRITSVTPWKRVTAPTSRQIDPAQRNQALYLQLQRRARVRGRHGPRYRCQPLLALLRDRASIGHLGFRMGRRCRRTRDRAGVSQGSLMARRGSFFWPGGSARVQLRPPTATRTVPRQPPFGHRVCRVRCARHASRRRCKPMFSLGQGWRKAWRDGSRSESCSGCHGDAATSMRGVAARYPA